MIRDKYPAVWSWVRKFEDLSGLEEAHCDNKEYLKEMLTFAGEVYFPFLSANRAALAAGEKRAESKSVEGEPHRTHPVCVQVSRQMLPEDPGQLC